MATVTEVASTEHVHDSKNEQNSPQHTFYDHPKYDEMCGYGYEDREQMRLALHIYLDLTEKQNWWNVEVLPCDALQQVLIRGHAAQTDPCQVVLPIRKHAPLTTEKLQLYLAKVKAAYHVSSLTIAMMDGDSNTVYFKITDGLVPPEPPEAMDEKKQRRIRKQRRRHAQFVRLSEIPQNNAQYPYYMAHRNKTNKRTAEKKQPETTGSRLDVVSKERMDVTLRDMTPTEGGGDRSEIAERGVECSYKAEGGGERSYKAEGDGERSYKAEGGGEQDLPDTGWSPDSEDEDSDFADEL